MYFGIVEDINDPLKLGRVKVRVHGKHDNRDGRAYKIDKKDLVWSAVMMPANTPAKNGIGNSVNLLIGTLVCGIFKDIEQQEFMVMGSLPTKTEGVDDNNVRVKGEADPNADDPTGEYQPISTYAPEYPYNNVMETESGHVKEYDDTPGLERIMERHKSGTQYEIDANGSKNETIVRDNYQLVVGQDTLEVFGNVRIIVSGQADIAVAADVNLAVGGNLAAEITGNGDITLKEGNLTTLISKGNCDLELTEGNLTTLISKGNCDFTMSEGTTTIKSEGLIKLDGNVNITGTLLVDETTTTSGSQVVDSHTHVISGGSSAGNTGALT